MTACYSPDARNWPPAAPPPDATPDAPHPDARIVTDARIDARIVIDAPGPVEVHVQVMGPGTVTLDGRQSCTKDCMLAAEFNVTTTLQAIPADKQKFDRWTSMTCAGQTATCTLVLIAPVTVSAHFVKAD